MARDPLEKETDVFNQMNQTMAFNNQMMKDQVASLKSKKKSAPAKAVVKKKSAAGPMPKVVQKKAPATPGGGGAYKGNPVPGGSTRPRYSGTPVPGKSSPSPVAARAAANAKPVAKPAAKPAAKTYTPDPSSFASSGVGRMLDLGNPNKKKSGYYTVMEKTGKAFDAAALKAKLKGESIGFKNVVAANSGAKPSGQRDYKPVIRTTAGIAGKSSKSVNQLFK